MSDRIRETCPRSLLYRHRWVRRFSMPSCRNLHQCQGILHLCLSTGLHRRRNGMRWNDPLPDFQRFVHPAETMERLGDDQPADGNQGLRKAVFQGLCKQLFNTNFLEISNSALVKRHRFLRHAPFWGRWRSKTSQLVSYLRTALTAWLLEGRTGSLHLHQW